MKRAPKPKVAAYSTDVCLGILIGCYGSTSAAATAVGVTAHCYNRWMRRAGKPSEDNERRIRDLAASALRAQHRPRVQYGDASSRPGAIEPGALMPAPHNKPPLGERPSFWRRLIGAA